MKKIIFILMVSLISISLFSQSTQLDFSMQFQNTNQHQALIYPNPTYDLAFKVQSSSIITNIEIVNMLGASLYKKSITDYSLDEITIRMPKCDKGVYMVKVTFDDNDTIIKKLLYR